ncbi:unnamed protein product [Penicillium nalgiovense]|uniref:Zn(2)-C6 fungal-type domain-containing protein n=1 Tax=Penicillium salamii TaxID=1612424 RepID=A0A9W4N5Q2_9EURO|nr:unnamed protein product [Penicillium salamii]CAG8892570.1 unnamed protein product [Penicillium nalgiovense]CAG7967908.1 unnamed protein product [Penicillium salamii]CAG7968113.1 unnamed protein product [Penicillium salamii]CAG8269772.1 unnamed protein product [Penicillium salamii]
MPPHHQSESAVRTRARTACQSCRKTRTRCIGGPPCENCIRLRKGNCEFVHTPSSKKLVTPKTRPERNACLPFRMKKALCNGVPPCEKCVAEGREDCAFGLESHKEGRPRKRRTWACLPCRLGKIRCTGGGAPCGTCISRGIGSTCEFIETTKDHPEEAGTHTTQNQYNGNGELSRNAVMEAGTIQQPESTLQERPENRPSPNSFTALDTRQVCRSESLGYSESLPTISDGNPLSDLSKSPSLDGSDLDKGAHPASLVGCSSHEELLDVLPSCQMIDCLIERYFESISMLFCAINAASFKAEYEVFCRNSNVTPRSWLSLLFAVLALACRAEEDPERGCLSDDLSMLYEKAAWDCLLTNDPPFEPSPTSLKAIVLIIYGRTHRGADVFSDLQLAYHTASSTKCHIDTTQCVVEPMVCAEYRQLLIGLKMLFLLNAQVHDYYRNRDITQGIERRADITERPHLPICVEGSPTTQMTFTILNLQLLEISDKICVSAERGLMSEWSPAGLETELFRIEGQCSEIYTKVSESDSQSGSHPGSQGILHCYINYLLHLLFLPNLQRYLNGDIAPGTRISQLKCIAFAKASLQCFNLLAEDMQSKSYGWYIRGLGSYYAEQSAYTLIRSRAGLQENDQHQEVRSILKRTLEIFSAFSDRSIFSTRGAFVIENQCMSRSSKAISRACISNFTSGFHAEHLGRGSLGTRGRYLIWLKLRVNRPF